MPAVAMTAGAYGLIGLLDHPSSGSASVGVGVGLGLGGASAPLPTQTSPTGNTQPPVVSSTLPALPQPAPQATPNSQAAPPVAVTTVPKPTAPAAASGSCQGKTVDGPSVNTEWGPVQVEAVVSSSGQICNVGAIRSPGGRRRSVSINQRALPILHDQVMKAQSARISGASGATVTTDGYVASLQAILDGTAG